MILVNSAPQQASKQGGLRPINLRTDLAALADLMEIAFRDSMDESGRAGIREMRYMSQLGFGTGLLSRLNGMAGVGMGNVWIADNKLVGNTTILPVDLPSEFSSAWQIVNVGVHPDYQRRGIARHLMQASMEMIRENGGKIVLLQVDYDNYPAINLYDSLGFVKERAFSTWWRSALAPTPPLIREPEISITRRRSTEWQAEYDLAERNRSNTQGGISWLKPLHEQAFKPGFWQRLKNAFSLNSHEHYIIRSSDESEILASLWIESGFAMPRTRLTLLNDPRYRGSYARLLLNHVLRLHRSKGLMMEHPHDDEAMNTLLKEYRFRADRTSWHMRAELE